MCTIWHNNDGKACQERLNRKITGKYQRNRYNLDLQIKRYLVKHKRKPTGDSTLDQIKEAV